MQSQPRRARPSDFVTSVDGTRIAVYRDGLDTEPPADIAGRGAGQRRTPTVLAVHGYPDNASVWNGVVAELADRCAVLRYDVRGAGASVPAPTRPRRGRADGPYRLARLIEDVQAVLAATSPTGPVHLLGHDLGSVQGWHFLAAPELAGRFASFTSISGPAVSQLRPWAVDALRSGRWRPALGQLLHSSYIPFFRLPALPELAWRSGAVQRLLLRHEPAVERSESDAVNGLELYRGDLLTGGRSARPVPVPVQVLAPRADPYVRADLQLQAPARWVEHYFPRPVEGGHWIVLSDPATIAAAVLELIDHVEDGRPMPAV